MEARAWQTVSFDCYGTLIDWETGISRAFQEEAARDGLKLDAGRILEAYMEIEPLVEAGPYRPYREVLAETAQRVAERLDWGIERDRTTFLPESLPHWPPFEDSRRALERLKSRYPIAILSNVDDDLLRETIDRLGVEFDWTVTATRTRTYKPNPGHFREAIRRVGEPGRLLHAAQSYYHDVRPAVQLGLAVVWVNRKGETRPDGPGPSRVVANLRELADWLLTE